MREAEAARLYNGITNVRDEFIEEIKNLTDFSQAVTTDIVYVVSGDRTGADKDRSYSFYTEYDGMFHWGCSVRCAEGTPVPEQFYGLTYTMIEEALSEVEYEDYIITYSPRLYVVFVWVRSPQGDFFLTYPARPDLLGIENGGNYTLAELQTILCDKYEDGRRNFKNSEGGM